VQSAEGAGAACLAGAGTFTGGFCRRCVTICAGGGAAGAGLASSVVMADELGAGAGAPGEGANAGGKAGCAAIDIAG
jgi:hypothetical protein